LKLRLHEWNGTPRQFTAIRDANAQAGRPLLPQEVLAAVRPGAPGPSIATAYRRPNAPVDGGDLRPIVFAGRERGYALDTLPRQCLRARAVPIEVEGKEPIPQALTPCAIGGGLVATDTLAEDFVGNMREAGQALALGPR
jgi:hypothetical protein